MPEEKLASTQGQSLGLFARSYRTQEYPQKTCKLNKDSRDQIEKGSPEYAKNVHDIKKWYETTTPYLKF